jgi:hypothetical protein
LFPVFQETVWQFRRAEAQSQAGFEVSDPRDDDLFSAVRASPLLTGRRRSNPDFPTALWAKENDRHNPLSKPRPERSVNTLNWHGIAS